MPNKLVNVGLHLQMLKFGSTPDPTKPSLEDNVKDVSVVAKARKHRLIRIGVELNYAENRALFAVQKLLDDTEFRGNARPVVLAYGNPYRMKGNCPVLDVRVSEYLEAYGVKKTKTARQKNEYSARGRRSALAALKSLARKSFLLSYKRETYHKTKKGEKLRSELIETVDRLITVKQQNGRLTIIPSPILSDQHDTYYMILSTDLYKTVLPDKKRSRALFIEHLFYHYERQRSGGGAKKYELIRQMETIAYAIGLGNLIETRQTKKLRSILNKYYEFAREIGYLRKYEIDAEGARYERVDKLYINASTMAKLRKVKEP